MRSGSHKAISLSERMRLRYPSNLKVVRLFIIEFSFIRPTGPHMQIYRLFSAMGMDQPNSRGSPSRSTWRSLCQRTGPLRATLPKYRPKETTLLPGKFPNPQWPQTLGDPITPPRPNLLHLRQITLSSRVALPYHGTRQRRPFPTPRRLRLVSIALIEPRSRSTDRIHGKGLSRESSSSWIP